jgi:uncharacterized protein YgiM (DUF1202 family)
MNKFVIALGLSLAASSAAFAQSSALDVYVPEPVKASVIDYTATASTGASETFELRAKLGDGSPVYVNGATGNVDYSATGSIGGASEDKIFHPRLSDGSPVYKN